MQYLEINNHSADLGDSNSIKSIFQSKNIYIFTMFGKFIAELYHIRDLLTIQVWI